MSERGFLVDMQAAACLVLWDCGMFCTADIAELLDVREDAVSRTVHMARDSAAGRKPDRASAGVGRPSGGPASGSERGGP
ncbi:MAG: hypothetical protein KF723_23040 [Rhizobiaceae bacterium]|nr:hypothetical protein [Rhizobiaceae bacterium]